MIHQPSAGTQGQASDMERATRQILRVKAMLNEIYVKHTGQPVEKIEKDLDRDTWLNAEEAKEWRLIDSIVFRRAEIPATASSLEAASTSTQSDEKKTL
jgi:ATP-dependent Clp protease protease subunit